jgi:hypothetical protein
MREKPKELNPTQLLLLLNLSQHGAFLADVRRESRVEEATGTQGGSQAECGSSEKEKKKGRYKHFTSFTIERRCFPNIFPTIQDTIRKNLIHHQSRSRSLELFQPQPHNYVKHTHVNIVAFGSGAFGCAID